MKTYAFADGYRFIWHLANDQDAANLQQNLDYLKGVETSGRRARTMTYGMEAVAYLTVLFSYWATSQEYKLPGLWFFAGIATSIAVNTRRSMRKTSAEFSRRQKLLEERIQELEHSS